MKVRRWRLCAEQRASSDEVIRRKPVFFWANALLRWSLIMWYAASGEAEAAHLKFRSS
jgi:hypothetical protein